MIQLTYGDLNRSDLVNALKKISAHNGYNIKLAYQISKIKSKVDREIKTAQELYKKIVTKYQVVDEQGQPAFDEKTLGPKIVEGKEELLDQEADELFKISFKIEQEHLLLDSLEGAKLSPNELIALEPLFQKSKAEEKSA